MKNYAYHFKKINGIPSLGCLLKFERYMHRDTSVGKEMALTRGSRLCLHSRIILETL